MRCSSERGSSWMDSFFAPRIERRINPLECVRQKTARCAIFRPTVRTYRRDPATPGDNPKVKGTRSVYRDSSGTYGAERSRGFRHERQTQLFRIASNSQERTNVNTFVCMRVCIRMYVRSVISLFARYAPRRRRKTTFVCAKRSADFYYSSE